MITAIQFILGLSLLILLHEGGHFFFAKLFKTKVEKFYLFFDFLFPFGNVLPFSLFKKKVGETTYGIGWFPLGGYVKIAGMIDESMDKEQLAKPPQPWEFRAKPAWQRLLIMLGGIIVNVLTAIIIYSFVLFIWGEKKLSLEQVNSKGGIMVVDSMGYQLGFQDGDKILSVNNEKVPYFDHIFEQILYAQTVQVERNGQKQNIEMPTDLIGQLIDNNKQRPFIFFPIPAMVAEVAENSGAAKAGLKPEDHITAVNGQSVLNFMELKKILKTYKDTSVALTVKRKEEVLNINAHVSDSSTLGFIPLNFKLSDLEHIGYYQLSVKEYGLAQAVPGAFVLAGEKIVSYYNQFKLMLNPKTGAYKGLGGFYSISKIYGPTWDWHRFWTMTAFLSIVLAFMNLLPIPGLDGGYVMFLLWEMITGRKVNEKVMEYATTVGLVLLLILMVYANGNDIVRNFFLK